jgi:hypothetical protein
MQPILIEKLWPEAVKEAKERQAKVAVCFQGGRIIIEPAENDFGFVAYRPATH